MSISSFLDKFKKSDTKRMLVGVVVIAVIVTVAFIFSSSEGNFSLSGIFGMSNNQIAEKVVNYINDNQLASTPASLVSVSEESGLVKVKIKIGTTEYDSYATRDGKLLFPQAFKLDPESSDGSDDSSGTTDNGTPAEITKTSSPMLEAYVVSRCPYGLQMQRAMAEAVSELPELANYIKARYIGYASGDTISSMHGEEEATENLRQICIREEQPAKYWSYVACQMKAGDTTGCEKTTAVDSAKLSACMSDASRGVAYAQEDFDLSTTYNISGSPTMMLNNTEASESNYGGRTADAIKAMVCAGFDSEPSFCSQQLNTESAAASFSETYSSSGATTDNSCG